MLCAVLVEADNLMLLEGVDCVHDKTLEDKEGREQEGNEQAFYGVCCDGFFSHATVSCWLLM